MQTLFDGLLLLVCRLVLPIAFIICLLWAVRDFRQTSQLRRNGISVRGQIVERRHSFITRGRTCFVRYRFATTAGQISTAEQEVSQQHYKRLEIGDSVEIAYLSNNVSISRLAGDDADNAARLRSLFYTLVLAVLFLASLSTFLKVMIH